MFSLTISKADFDLLGEIAGMTGSTPSALIRELVEDNRATFMDIRDSMVDAREGNADRAFSRMEERLKRVLQESQK